MTTARRLLIASESKIISSGFELLIKGWNEFGEITQAPLSALPAVVAKLEPDIILVFAPCAPRSIVRTLRKFSTDYPRSRAVVLLTDEDSVSSLTLLHGEAFGIISYRATLVDFRGCLSKVRSGLRYIDPQFTEATLGLRYPTAHPSQEILSERETEVLRRIALGHTQKEIAGQLKISTKSVGTYHSRIALKLHTTSRVDMVKFAIAAGLM